MVDVCMVGLGPVGLVSGACFAKQGFSVMGVDIDPKRVDAVKHGRAGFIEPGIDELITQVHSDGLLDATDGITTVAQEARVIMLAVATPTPAGAPDLSYLDNVARSLGAAFKQKHQKDVVIVLRSTVPPGTMRNRLAPIIEKISGLTAGKDFHIASNPEFLREGQAIEDFFHTGRVVIGADNSSAGEVIAELYKDVQGERIVTTIETAEFAKYVDNSWHALKIAFANEVGRVVEAFGGSVDDTTRIFLADDKLNVSPYYLRPGFAFGGSCLPKDVRGLCFLARELSVEVPVLGSVLQSNYAQIRLGVDAIMAHRPSSVGILGIAFKPHVDDLRESPYLIVASELVKRGVAVLIHDQSYADGSHIALPGTDMTVTTTSKEEIFSTCDVLALSHDIEAYGASLASSNASIVDLTKTLPPLYPPTQNAA